MQRGAIERKKNTHTIRLYKMMFVGRGRMKKMLLCSKKFCFFFLISYISRVFRLMSIDMGKVDFIIGFLHKMQFKIFLFPIWK